MYSFTSSADFDNKTGYVTDTFITVDSSGHCLPMQTPVMFCDLYDMYSDEIADCHARGVGFIGDALRVGRFMQNGAVTNSYVYIRLRVETDGTLHTQRVVSSTTPPSFPSGSYESTCTKQQYIDGDRQADNGKLYLVSQWGYDSSQAATLSEKADLKFVWGQKAVYNGTWNPNFGSHGRMEYNFSGNYALPVSFPLGTADQNGCPSNSTAALQNQPNIVGNWYGSYSSNPQYDYKIVTEDGGYDPDPVPPTPTDPNADPNHEPGDNPQPRPGGHERDYDPIPLPPTPTVTSLGAGFTSLYVPTEAILHVLADEIFSDNIIQIIENYFNNPQDMIAGLSLVPFVVPVSGQYYHKVGRYTSSVAMQRASSQFIDVDCGSVLIDHYYNNFLDTAPFTKIKIWLPYIGYQDISVDDVMGCTVSVKYRCDILSGACVAFIYTGLVGETGPQVERVIAQYSGNCAVQVPTGSESYDNMISTAINILTTAGATAVGGGGMMAAVEGIASSAANYITSMKPDVRRNGTPGSTSGYMAVQKPYIIRFTPRSSIPDDFINLKGYASNRSGQLGGFPGYVEVNSIKLENVAATDGEIQEILSLLQGGVFV